MTIDWLVSGGRSRGRAPGDPTWPPCVKLMLRGNTERLFRFTPAVPATIGE